MRGTPSSEFCSSEGQAFVAPATSSNELNQNLLALSREYKTWEEDTDRWEEFRNETTDNVFLYGSGNNREHQETLRIIGRRQGRKENVYRLARSYPPLDLSLINGVLRFHDTHEYLVGDQAHGTKSPESKAEEYAAMAMLVEEIADPKLQQQGQRILEIAKDPKATPEGRFFKAMEQLDHLRVALNVHQRALVGNENHIRKPHLLVWDVLHNNLSKLFESTGEFPSINEWLSEHQHAIIAAMNTVQIRPGQALRFQREMASFSPKRSYPSPFEMIRQSSVVREKILALPAIGSPKQSMTAHEQRSEQSPEFLTELIDGTETMLAA